LASTTESRIRRNPHLYWNECRRDHDAIVAELGELRVEAVATVAHLKSEA
jgi:hypothetical protein